MIQIICDKCKKETETDWSYYKYGQGSTTNISNFLMAEIKITREKEKNCNLCYNCFIELMNDMIKMLKDKYKKQERI